MSWKEFFADKKNRTELIVTLLLLALLLSTLANFLNFIEERPGVILYDPLLALFSPIDLTWLTFGLIYVSLVAGVISLIKKPNKLIFAIQLYCFMVIIRIISMYLLPLEPPASMLILHDPFVEFFGTGRTLTKDLFFSGHTATLFLLYLISEKRSIKTIFLISTIAVAISVLLQHVHYTIDVLAALFFTYACFRMLKDIKSKMYIVRER